MRRRGIWLAVAVLLLLGGVVGAAIRRHGTPPSSVPDREPVFAESDAPFPSDSASDVVSFADHVVLVTAVAEKEATPTATPTAPGTGDTTVARDVTFRIDRSLWSHAKAREAPARFTMRWWGWLVEGRKRTPIAVTGTPWVFVGGQYVVPIAYDGTSFSVLQPFAVFRYDRGTVTLEEQNSPLARRLDQADAERVAVTFADAVPDPVAEQHRDLTPRARLTAVLATRGGQSQPPAMSWLARGPSGRGARRRG
ncbi:MAG TPA: hypothetical protein VNA14_04520 [Mycobacteriales bacterium]|nr:hypothetical protein [Mycobacteriales bacterium]